MICVDASVAIKWLLPDNEDYADNALALLNEIDERAETIVAPPLLWSEITNALRQRVRQAVLSVDEALSIFDDFLGLGIIAQSPDGLHRLALELACRYELPAAYDAHYVALAELLDCALWTDDRRLVTQIRPRPNYLRPISDYKQSTV